MATEDEYTKKEFLEYIVRNLVEEPNEVQVNMTEGQNTIVFENFSYSLTITITTSIFYLIIGVFAGLGDKLLTVREKLLEEKTEELKKETEYRKNEWKQLDKTTKLSTFITNLAYFC